MNKQDKIEVILVDDHKIITDGLSALLATESDIEVVAVAQNGKEAISLCQSFMPSVIVMDLDMPVMSGSLAAKKIITDFPETSVIILSLHSEKSIIQNLMHVGIDSYLIKSEAGQDLIKAIRTVHQGNKYFSAEIAMILSSLKPSNLKTTSEASYTQFLALLTERETEVLKHIANGQSNKEIANLLTVSSRTIDNHRMNLMNKLDIHKVTGLVRFALKSGLVE